MRYNPESTMHENPQHDTKERVALTSIFASAGIAAAKFAAGLLSGSLALMSEAGHAVVDTAATVMTYAAIRTANKPADEDHQYGHGKFESLSALAETILLFVLATVVVMRAWARLTTGGSEFEPTLFAFGVIAVSIAVDAQRIRLLRKTAKETGSQALAADALHFASDLVGSVLVLLGLIAASFGFRYGDPIAALGVAGFIAIAGWRLGKQTIDTLLDRAPEGLDAQIRDIAESMPGVIEVRDLRLRHGGTHLFGDLSLAVSETESFLAVSEIKKATARAIKRALPAIDLTVTAVPVPFEGKETPTIR